MREWQQKVQRYEKDIRDRERELDTMKMTMDSLEGMQKTRTDELQKEKIANMEK